MRLLSVRERGKQGAAPEEKSGCFTTFSSPELCRTGVGKVALGSTNRRERLRELVLWRRKRSNLVNLYAFAPALSKWQQRTKEMAQVILRRRFI